MTNKKRFLMALTVVSFLTVTGLVIGCDSDDGPKVTPPSGGGGGATATRNTTAETQGREGLEATDNGTMIRNTGEVALNVRFAYDTPRHYRLNVNTAMPSDPASAGSAPARVACGVPATGRANGQCFNNDRSEIQSAPTPYSSGNGNGDNGNGDNGNGDNGNGDNGGSGGGGTRSRWHPSQAAANCVQRNFMAGTYLDSDDNPVDDPRGRLEISNTCLKTIETSQGCSTESPLTSSMLSGRTVYTFPSFGAQTLQPGQTGLSPQQSGCRKEGGDLVFVACYEGYDPYFLSPSLSGRIEYDCHD